MKQSEIIWFNLIKFSVMHLIAFWGVLLAFKCYPQTLFWNFIYGSIGHLGITAGAHRLWSHRSYKAKLPLRVFLAVCNCIALQNSIFDWARDHRTHHKYSETNADPHNAKRGFLFSHVGWIFCRKHPDVVEKGKGIDVSDLLNDPVVVFQRKYYHGLCTLACFAVPTLVPTYFWKERILVSFCINMLRYVAFLNVTFLVNSAAHMWGYRPYDANINPAENLPVAILTLGEGFHNYHHVFPQDYRTSELGIRFNISTAFIDVMAFFQVAYDLTTVSKATVLARRKRTGAFKDF
ncbi:unnamed protein product [Clavelina lepadiformis]|uniref:Fatty acid desaturase domain-containing protein n=1 Tax=Clavelina lepadiformis TaxID=159417 RepID=A0ABP0GX40_CLALP